MNCLIDTGACVSLLRYDVFIEICNRSGRSRLLGPAPALFTVSGAPIKVHGKTEVVFEVLGSLPMLIVEGTIHQCILGDDALSASRAVLNYSTRELIWKGKVLKLCPYSRHLAVSEMGPQHGVSSGDLYVFDGSTDPAYEDVIRQNNDVFYREGQPFGQCPLTEITIDTGDSPPIRQRPYRTPLAKRKIVEECIDQMLSDGVIVPSNSPWASPICLVPKKDGSTRFCVDYRALNNVTIKDRYPLPLIQDIFDQLGGKRVYSVCDLKSAYNQLRVASRDQQKTAFVCHRGQFQYTVGSFGLANMPSIFQRTMELALSELLGKCVWIFIDDLVIASGSPEEHIRDLEAVFALLRRAKLSLKGSKCYFGKTNVQLLGYIITPDGIHSDPEKVRAIVEMPAPQTVKQVRSFVGMVNYYSKTIPGYSRVVEPLTKLTRKNQIFEWGQEQQEAFDTLKGLLTSSEVMAYPRTNHSYKLYTDASNTCVGGILVQDDDQGIERVIQYVSHQLTATQRRWATIEKEAYAVVYCIDKLRAYLYGADFTVYTDHKPLRSLFTKEMRNTKVQRWGVFLAEFGAKIQYIQGARNVRADLMSRLPSQVEVAVLDTVHWVDPDSLQGPHAIDRIPLGADLLQADSVRKSQLEQFPSLFIEAREEESDYEVHDGLLYSIKRPTDRSPWYPRLVLPQEFRDDVIDRCHRDVGHMSTAKTLHRVREAYAWLGMRKDIAERLKLCATCAVNQRRKERDPMSDMPLPAYPMQVVGMDLIGPFVPSNQGNRYALTVVDHLSGWAEAFPIKDKSSLAVEEALATEFFPRHGVPEVVITDRGLEFSSKRFTAYLNDLGVQQRQTTPYHPETQGKIERLN